MMTKETRGYLADYFSCDGPENAADFYGINMYEWCGTTVNFETSGYADRTKEFENFTIPVFFSEYGCNVPQPRTFADVPSLYSSNMTDTWSGGIVYMYFEEANNYGLVTIQGDSSVSTLRAFLTYQAIWLMSHPRVSIPILGHLQTLLNVTVQPLLLQTGKDLVIFLLCLTRVFVTVCLTRFPALLTLESTRKTTKLSSTMFVTRSLATALLLTVLQAHMVPTLSAHLQKSFPLYSISTTTRLAAEMPVTFLVLPNSLVLLVPPLPAALFFLKPVVMVLVQSLPPSLVVTLAMLKRVPPVQQLVPVETQLLLARVPPAVLPLPPLIKALPLISALSSVVSRQSLLFSLL